MGNVLLDDYKKVDPADSYQRWLEQYPDLTGRQILSENKLFRVSSFKLNNRNLVMKVFFKRDPSPLTEYLKIFQTFNNNIEGSKSSHLLPLKLRNTKDHKTIVVATRQKIYQTLQDTINMKPGLNEQQKKWMIYQAIRSVKTLHRKFNLFHGHIRTSNFVVTTSGYVMLTDFAFYKPLYMFEDTEEGLPELRLFYGSSYENCTLAPEKIAYRADFANRERNPAKIFQSYNLSVEEMSTTVLLGIEKKKESPQKPKPQINFIDYIDDLKKMDIFSLGCTILQILRDGKPLLNYENLLKLKKGQFSLVEQIQEGTKNLQNGKQIQELLTKMLKTNSQQRINIEQVWFKWNLFVDQDVFNLFWHCLSAFSTTSFNHPDTRIALLHSIFKFIEQNLRNNICQFSVDPPKCFEKFEALKLFQSLIRNKLIYLGDIPKGSLLDLIINYTEKQQSVDSEQEIMNEEKDARREFFFSLKRRGTSLRLSTSATFRLDKVLCPPQWDHSLSNLIQTKYKGTKLTIEEEQKNREQDLLQEYKKTQFLRATRKNQQSNFYLKLIMAIKIIFSCIRGCKYNASKLIGIELMMMIGRESNDYTRLIYLFPRLLTLLDDPHRVVAYQAFHSIIDLFYLFIDPYHDEEEVGYYDSFIEMLINNLKTVKLRIELFRRLGQISNICEWLQIRIKQITKKPRKNTFQKFINIIKQEYGSFSETQRRQLMINVPERILFNIFEYFISFMNNQKILGVKKSIEIVENNSEGQRKKLDNIDSIVESELNENGIPLYYAIKYFTTRRKFTDALVKKIAAFVIHPHLWVQTEARAYLEACLQQNPPTRMFFLLRDVFEPPFPLQPCDLSNSILIPPPLTDSQVDFNKKIVNTEKKGLTLKLFLEYLEKMKPSRQFPKCTQERIMNWNSLVAPFIDKKIDPIQFSSFIKKAIVDLYESNFLYVLQISNIPYPITQTNEQKERCYMQLNQVFKKTWKFSIDDNIISYEKNNFFSSILAFFNTNFEKFLIKFQKENAGNKFKIAQLIYLVMEIMYRFEQFNIQKTTKLGEYYRKTMEPEKIMRPKGTLVTEIFEHKDVITSLEKIADSFLISGSYDGKFRLFNTKKIDMNITVGSEAVCQITSDVGDEKVRINSIAAFQNTFSIAVGTNRGQIRIYNIERMASKTYQVSNRQSSGPGQNNMELLKYVVGGEVQKIITMKNQQQNECFCFVTAEGNLGIQDIRIKSKALSCNVGKERGLPKSLAYSRNGNNVLIGTIDGYLLCYDARCNILSNIQQLFIDQQSVSITGIFPAPSGYGENSNNNVYALTYPSKNYQFAYFNVFNDQKEFGPIRHYTSAQSDSIVSPPYLANRTTEENFKTCPNTLTQKIYYKQLPDFNRNFKILEHLGDPLTLRESKIREFWMDRCKHRYNQVYSVYNKKCLPFIQHLPSGILTNLNPCITSPSDLRSNRNLSILVDKKQTKQYYDIEKFALPKHQLTADTCHFLEEEASHNLACCEVFPTMIAVGGWDSVIKIYK